MRRAAVERLAALVAFALLVVASGCEEVMDDEPPSCDLPFHGGQIEGDWMLQARGVRESCKSRRLEGALTVEPSDPIQVQAEAVETTGRATGPEPTSEADAFVDRIERSDYVLRASNLPEGLEFEGESTGACIGFTLIETLPDGDVLEYAFDGFILARGFIQGDFRGTGPERCETDGTFDVQVQP